MELQFLEFLEAIARCADRMTSFPLKFLSEEDKMSTPRGDIQNALFSSDVQVEA
jgi:hypothetical protein